MRGGRRLTACRAMVADDREEVIGGDLGRALLGEEGAQVKALEGEGHVAADLERVHDLVPKALQVNAQDLRWGGGERCWSFVGWPGAHDPRHLMEVSSQGSGTPPYPPTPPNPLRDPLRPCSPGHYKKVATALRRPGPADGPALDSV